MECRVVKCYRVWKPKATWDEEASETAIPFAEIAVVH